MHLDDFSSFPRIDVADMLAEIDALPNQLEKGWKLGQHLPLPEWRGLRYLLFAGMGGSAIGADLLAAYLEPLCSLPIIVHRDYGLPTWAQGSETLVVVTSHSGNTEEALSAFAKAVANGCRVLALCTGGKLAEAAERLQIPLWRFEHRGQPRAAVGYSFALPLAAMHRLDLIPNVENDLYRAVAAMRSQQERLQAQQPLAKNPAKRLAGQLMERWVVVFGAQFLAPVARRWKGQINELAKAWGQFEYLPEADHNTLAGLLNPQNILEHTVALFLRAPAYLPRNQRRIELTKQAFMLEGVSSDLYDAPGDTPLAQQWTALHFGDYLAYYLAMLYETDPTAIDSLLAFKAEMGAFDEE